MPISVYTFLLLQLFIVSWLDLKYKKIANYWSLINLAVFLVVLFVFPEAYHFSLGTFALPFGWIAVGIILFALKIMGAGDSKYLFSMFLLIPEDYHLIELICLLYVTCFVGGGLLLYNSLRNFDKLLMGWRLRDVKMIKSVYGHRFSFAPVIAVSWIWFGLVLLKVAHI